MSVEKELVLDQEIETHASGAKLAYGSTGEVNVDLIECPPLSNTRIGAEGSIEEELRDQVDFRSG